MTWMSLVEFSRAGRGQVVKVADTVNGKDVTLFLVDLYLKLPRPPSSCDEALGLQPPGMRLCYVKAGDCTLTVLITPTVAEVIGGSLFAEGGSPVGVEEARSKCERSAGQLASAAPR